MSKILLLDKILNSLKEWIKNHHKIVTDIEDIILQRDSTDAIEEKLISIGLSSLLVYIGLGIAGLFGIATGGILIAIVLFPIGWIISKLINKKIFGTQRKIEDTTDEEQTLLIALQNIDEQYRTMGLQIRFKKLIVNFTEYKKQKDDLQTIANNLETYDASPLALKYRLKHKLITTKYKKQANKFDTIYAHKKGKRYA